MDIATFNILLLALVTTAVLVIYDDADVALSTSTNTVGRLLRLGTGKITYNYNDQDEDKPYHQQLPVGYVFDP